MFLTVLGGTLALGAGLLAAAGYSEGTVVAARTAALAIGWLLLFATLIGAQGVRRRRLAELGTTAVVFFSGVAVLYLSYFHWSELLPELETHMKVVAVEPFAASATFVSLPTVARVPVPRIADKPQIEKEPVAHPCASLRGVEALQCRRCGEKSGVAWLLCQERARLEYCEGKAADEALCPSAVPAATTDYVPPG